MTPESIVHKNIFLKVCVSLSELGPSEPHWKVFVKSLCGSSYEKGGGKLLLSWRHWAPLVRPAQQTDLLRTKNRQVGKPKLRLNRIETAGRYATVRFDTLLWRDMHFNSRSSLACLSSACMSLGMLLKAKFTPAVSSVQSLTLPPPPPLSLSLCLSLRVTRFEKKNHFR